MATDTRNHTEEYAKFDLGYAADIKFFACIPPIDENFGISEDATINLQANNIDSFTSPPLDITLSRTDLGVYKFIDDNDDTRYRHWKFKWIDKENPGGPQIFHLGHIFLGNYVTITNRNVARGFKTQEDDPSNISRAEDGTLYFDEKQKYELFDGLQISYLDRADKDALKLLWRKLGKTNPFYISIDPLNNITTEMDELTRYVYFSSIPDFTHIHSDVFSTSFDVREVI